MKRKDTSLSKLYKAHRQEIIARHDKSTPRYALSARKSQGLGCRDSSTPCACIPPVRIAGICRESLAMIDVLAQQDPDNVSIKIAGWFDGRERAVVADCKYEKESKVGKFALTVPVPASNPPEFLKLAVLGEIYDNESGNKKLFTLETMAVSLREMLHNREVGKAACGDKVVEETYNVFNDALKSHLEITVENLDEYSHPDVFVESPIRRIAQHNKGVDDLIVALTSKFASNNLRPPRPGIPFYTGNTFAPFGGVPSMQIPPLKTHYALLGAMLSGLDRKYPLGLPLYFLNSAMLHSGYTQKDVERILQEGCKSTEYARLTGDILLGFTKDAACMTYQRDATLSMEIENILTKPQLRLCLANTEDINIVGTTQSLLTEAQQDIPYEEREFAHHEMPMKALVAVLHTREYTEISRCLGKDDCESSAMLALLLGKTIQHADLSAENLRQATRDWEAFQNYTAESYEFSSRVLTRIQADLKAGNIQLAPVVGLAGGASVDNDKGGGETTDGDAGDYLARLRERVEKEKQLIDRNQAGGHCFGMLRMLHPDTQQVYNMILEGTNSTRILSESEIFPVKVSVTMGKSKRGEPISKQISMNSCDFLSALSHIVSVVSQVCVADNGQDAPCRGGLRLPNKDDNKDNSCVIRSQMGIFEKDPAFYKWILHMGLVSDKFVSVIPCSMNKWESDDKLAAGMFPGETNNGDSNALVVSKDMYPQESMDLCSQYLNEVYMPIAEDSEFARLTNMWAKLEPLENVNSEASKLMQRDVKYIVMNSMETPMAPALTPVILAAKQKLCNEVNERQARDSKSDGIVAWVTEHGTGVVWSTAVPVGLDKEVTFIRHLREAAVKLGFAGATC